MTVQSPSGELGHQSFEEYHASLEQINKAAGAIEVSVKEEQAKIEGQQAQTVGQMAEGKHKEAGAEHEQKRQAANPIETVAAEIGVAAATGGASTVVGASVQLASAGLERLSEKSTDPRSGVDAGKVAKQTGGLSGTKQTSFEDMSGRIKQNPQGNMKAIESPMRGRSVLTKAMCAEKSLGGQGGTTVGSAVQEQNLGVFAATKTQVMSLGIASALVQNQVKAMQNKHAANLSPAPGGSGSVPKSQAATLENDAMCKGPAYITPEQATRMAESMETKDTSDNWGTA